MKDNCAWKWGQTVKQLNIAFPNKMVHKEFMSLCSPPPPVLEQTPSLFTRRVTQTISNKWPEFTYRISLCFVPFLRARGCHGNGDWLSLARNICCSMCLTLSTELSFLRRRRGDLKSHTLGPMFTVRFFLLRSLSSSIPLCFSRSLGPLLRFYCPSCALAHGLPVSLSEALGLQRGTSPNPFLKHHFRRMAITFKIILYTLLFNQIVADEQKHHSPEITRPAVYTRPWTPHSSNRQSKQKLWRFMLNFILSISNVSYACTIHHQ